MKKPQSKSDSKALEHRIANRKALLEQAAHIPEGATYVFLKPVNVDSSSGKSVYHAADNKYVYGVDAHGESLQVEHASNTFYSPLIHKVIAAIKDVVAEEESAKESLAQ